MMVSQEQLAVQHHEKLIGSILRDGEYQVCRLLGQGGAGMVFLARHTSLAVPFALKQMPADSPLPEEVIAELDALLQGHATAHQLAIGTPAPPAWTMPRSGGERTDHFIREALFLARLHHPAIPTLYDYFFQDGYWYLVMDYIAGSTLRACLPDCVPLPVLEALGYAIQLCEVLDYLHKQHPPVIFRDLKPANALLKPDGTLLLIDFGSACYYKEALPDGLLPLGSPGYLAPEQCRADDQLDARADLYSLGVMLYEMLSGQRPVPGQRFNALHQVNPNISHVLSGLVRLATRSDPGQRFQSAYIFYLALERAYGIEERRTYQQFVIAKTATKATTSTTIAIDPQTPDPVMTAPDEQVVFPDADPVELSTRDAFDNVAPSRNASELERRLALREALRHARQKRLAEELLESQLASVDESLKRRAMSLSQSSLQAVTPVPSAHRRTRWRSGRPARKARRVIQVGIFLLLICFVVLTSLLVYLHGDYLFVWQMFRPEPTANNR